jgi:hypothetical protein
MLNNYVFKKLNNILNFLIITKLISLTKEAKDYGYKRIYCDQLRSSLLSK